MHLKRSLHYSNQFIQEINSALLIAVSMEMLQGHTPRRQEEPDISHYIRSRVLRMVCLLCRTRMHTSRCPWGRSKMRGLLHARMSSIITCLVSNSTALHQSVHTTDHDIYTLCEGAIFCNITPFGG